MKAKSEYLFFAIILIYYNSNIYNDKFYIVEENRKQLLILFPQICKLSFTIDLEQLLCQSHLRKILLCNVVRDLASIEADERLHNVSLVVKSFDQQNVLSCNRRSDCS